MQFLPLYIPSQAPRSPSQPRDQWVRNTEPIYVTTQYWAPRKRRGSTSYDQGGEYLSFYYVGHLTEDTVNMARIFNWVDELTGTLQQHENGTGMADEQEYESHLLSPDDAMARLQGTTEELVVREAWILFEQGLKHDEFLRDGAMEALSVADEPLNPSA